MSETDAAIAAMCMSVLRILDVGVVDDTPSFCAGSDAWIIC